MTKVASPKKSILTKTEAEKILGSTPYMKGFHFNSPLGNYIEETSTSLSELENALARIDEGSILFHFQRQDFQKWIRDILGDSELASRIDRIKATLAVEELRNRLAETVQTRIIELEEIVQKTYSQFSSQSSKKQNICT